MKLAKYAVSLWIGFKKAPFMYVIGLATSVYWYVYAINNGWR